MFRHPLNDSVEVLKVLPNKLTYAWVFWYGLIRVVDFLICSHRPFEWYIIDVGDGDMRDFSL
jgi:hypothetical protein